MLSCPILDYLSTYGKINPQNSKTDNEKYVYTLKILDKTLNVDNDFPEIPNVKSSIMAQKEDIVVVLLLYGGSDVFVLGRCER